MFSRYEIVVRTQTMFLDNPPLWKIIISKIFRARQVHTPIKKIRLESLKADIFKGRVDGGIEISFLPSISYNLNLEVSDLNLKEITQKFAPPRL